MNEEDMKVNWFSTARVSVLITLVTGIYLHLSRLIFGIDLTLEKLVTTAFDSVFALVLIFAVMAIFRARKQVLFRNRLERFLFYFTLIYFSISVPIHVRTWFVPNNPQTLRLFPEWYSVFFLFLTGSMIIGWWNLRAKVAT
jgi:hypothetical protein